MLILGIDPGSIKTGWALLKTEGKKTHYVASGVLSFDSKKPFLERLTEIRKKTNQLVKELKPDEVALESLIYVKSPTALIKLAQSRGVILSQFVEEYQGKIFEYSPNLVKSSAVGHGHADKESVKKVIDMMFGAREYKSHDETDAIAVALCHVLNRNKKNIGKLKKNNVTRKSGKGLAGALSHKI